MKTSDLKTFLAVVVIAVLTNGAAGQQNVKFLPSDSKITIKGTSNLHDWEETVGKFNVNLSVQNTNIEITRIDHVHLVCKTSSISSDYTIMTNKTMEALKTDKYPEIVFSMETTDKLAMTNGKLSGILSGYLNLAGTSKRINVAFEGSVNNNRIVITGSKEINMIDFKIKPPTAMMGALKTGETVVVSFLLHFQIV